MTLYGCISIVYSSTLQLQQVLKLFTKAKSSSTRHHQNLSELQPQNSQGLMLAGEPGSCSLYILGQPRLVKVDRGNVLIRTFCSFSCRYRRFLDRDDLKHRILYTRRPLKEMAVGYFWNKKLLSLIETHSKYL